MKSIQEIQDDQYNVLLKESTQSIRDYIVEVSKQAQEEGKPVEELIDEGLLGSLVGGVIGATAGKSIMQCVCKALGINESGSLGSMLTSRMVLTAVGTQMGYRW